MTTTFAPDTAGGTDLARLVSSPLKRVLCVIRFAPILRISDPSGTGIAAFQDSIRSQYSSLKMDFHHEIELEADDNGVIGEPRISKHPIWRFTEKAGHWRASLAPNMVMLEVDDTYDGRDELVDRFSRLVTELVNHYDPVAFELIGIRFFNIFDNEKLEKLDKYVRNDFMALRKSLSQVELVTSMNQLHVKSGNQNILIKHGFLQPGFQTDMQQQPLDTQAWVLDIDVNERLDDSDEPSSVKEKAKDITDTICSFFSWSVTKTFIEDYRRG